MVNSYPARTKSDNLALFISCSLGYYTVRWTVPTFLSTSFLLQSQLAHTTQLTEQCIIVIKHTKHELYKLFKKCVFIVAMVTVQLLGLQVQGGLCPDQNGKTFISSLPYGIFCTINCTAGH